jgi:hypothetical protein
MKGIWVVLGLVVLVVIGVPGWSKALPAGEEADKLDKVEARVVDRAEKPPRPPLNITAPIYVVNITTRKEPKNTTPGLPHPILPKGRQALERLIHSRLNLSGLTGIKEIKVLPDKLVDELSKKPGFQRQSIKDISLKVENEMPVYNVEGRVQVKILGLIPAEMNVKAKVDAQTGEILGVERPWWSFLAR